MARQLSQPESINVLIGNANWAWPQAVAELFQPRGVNALMANSPHDAVQLVENNKIHLAILDLTWNDLSGMQTLKMIRKRDELLPCLLVAQQIDDRILAEALALNVFSVLLKPVDLGVLGGQLNRLFRKYYDNNTFSEAPRPAELEKLRLPVRQRVSTVIKWTVKRNERSSENNEDQTLG